MSTTPRNLSIEEVCARLGISIRTLRTLIQTGQAPPSIKLGQRRLFPEDRFEEYHAELQASAR